MVRGYLQRDYDELQPAGTPLSSRFTYMGGILAKVSPKRGVRGMEIWEGDGFDGRRLVINGLVPRADRRDHVTVTVTDAASGLAIFGRGDCEDDGRYAVDLDLGELAALGGRDPDDIGGSYEVVAETFASATVTDIATPPIVVTR